MVCALRINGSDLLLEEGVFVPYIDSGVDGIGVNLPLFGLSLLILVIVETVSMLLGLAPYRGDLLLYSTAS